jgi:uncharacterized membrane protein
MYSGLYQYNAEIIPILIIATIEALALLLWLVRLIRITWKPVKEKTRQASRAAHLSFPIWLHTDGMKGCILAILLGLALFSTIRSDVLYHGHLPFSQGFQWPMPSAHTALAQQFIEKLPPHASVSAQSQLVPHLSHRSAIYLFPYAVNQAQYIFLDVTSGVYPYYSFHDYLQAVKDTLSSGQYGILAAQDGYLLLRHGLPLTDTASCPANEQGQYDNPGPVLSSLLGHVCSQPSSATLQ